MRAITLALLTSLFLAACSQRAVTPTSVDITGSFSLVSIDGHEIPYAASEQGQQGPEVISSTLSLNGDGTFSMTMIYKNPAGGSVSRDFSGTYTKEGADFLMKWKGAGQTKATIEGSQLTLNNEGLLFVYQK